MATRTIVYDTWREEYGDRGPRWAGRQRNKGAGFFGASNLVVYRSGAIGPRAGLRAYDLESVPTGAVTGLFDAPFPGNTCLFSVDDDLWYFDSEDASGTATVVSTGAFATSTTQVEAGGTYAGTLFLTSFNDSTYSYADVADELTDLGSDTFGGFSITLHGDRLFVGGDEPNNLAGRVQYSDAADFDNFDALNYFDIYGPGGSETLNMISLGSRLIIQNEDNLHVYQGVPGLDSLRKIIRRGIGVARTTGAIVNAGDDLWYATRNGTLGWGNGSLLDGNRFAHLSLGTEDVRAVYDPFHDAVLLVADGGGALMMREGVWTQLTLPSTLTNKACNRYVPGTREEGFVLTDGGGASTAATFYSMVTDLERPGFSSDTFANVGDGSSTPFDAHLHLPEYISDSGAELIVREVKVDFVKWQTGQSETTHFDVTVEALSRYDTDDVLDSRTLAFDEPNNQTASGATGTEARFNATFGDQGSSAGFRVKIDDIRACAIRGVYVVVEERTGRSR